MHQNATHLRKSAPWPRNISDEHVSCSAPAPGNASLQTLLKSPTPANIFETATKSSRFSHFWQGAKGCACHTKRDLNVQKWSGTGSFWHFWLGNVLRATTACNCSSLENTVIRYFSTFSPTGIFFLLTPSLLWSSFFFFLLYYLLCLLSSFFFFFFSSFFFLLSSSFFLLPFFFFLPLLSPLLSSALLCSPLLCSALLFSSLLFSDSSHLRFFICPFCRKFDF